MVWDYAEANPFAASSGGWSHNLGFIDRLISAVIASRLLVGHVEQASASSHPFPNDSVQALVTDPPYYDAVPYAHLSDFFYVWLRRALPSDWSPLFAADAVPKEAEIVVDRPHYLSTSNKDIAFYERELTKAFKEARRVVAPGGIGTIVFASKTTASWEAILKAVVDAGWIITGSWPIDTEREGRMAANGQARLASSVHIVCRPRENSAGMVLPDEIGDWRDVLQELPRRIHEWMPRLAQEGVVGADAIFSCLGPALEIFSRYSRVEKPNGDQVTLKEYLEYVWAAVSKEAISMIFAGADTTGFEEDARLTAMWLWTLSPGLSDGESAKADEIDGADDDSDEKPLQAAKLTGFTLEYDAARKIAQGLGAHLELLVNLVEVKGETARLLPVAERTKALFGKEGTESPAAKRKKSAQLSLPGLLEELEQEESGWTLQNAAKPGSTNLDRLHQAMILFAAGRGEGLRRFLVDDGVGKDQKFWSLGPIAVRAVPERHGRAPLVRRRARTEEGIGTVGGAYGEFETVVQGRYTARGPARIKAARCVRVRGSSRPGPGRASAGGLPQCRRVSGSHLSDSFASGTRRTGGPAAFRREDRNISGVQPGHSVRWRENPRADSALPPGEERPEIS